MIEVSIPGFKNLKIEHLVLDYNGTIAYDGKVIDGIRERLNDLAKSLHVHVITADTFGQVEKELEGIQCQLYIIPKVDQAVSKLNYINQLDSQSTICIGNGRNDCLMLKEAALGIALFQGEGGAVEALLAADLISPSIIDALDLLINPLRLIATLRS